MNYKYRVFSTYLAGYLLMNGFEIVESTFDKDQDKVIFYFEDSSDLRKCESKYKEDNFLQDYIDSVTHVKKIIKEQRRST